MLQQWRQKQNFYLFSYSAHPSIDVHNVHCSAKLEKKILFNFSFSFPLKYSFSLSLSLLLLFLFVKLKSLSPLSSFSISSLSFLSSSCVIGDGVGWWVSWMAWVSGSAMAMAMAMAGLLSLSIKLRWWV